MQGHLRIHYQSSISGRKGQQVEASHNRRRTLQVRVGWLLLRSLCRRCSNVTNVQYVDMPHRRVAFAALAVLPEQQRVTNDGVELIHDLYRGDVYRNKLALAVLLNLELTKGRRDCPKSGKDEIWSGQITVEHLLPQVSLLSLQISACMYRAVLHSPYVSEPPVIAYA